MKRFSETQFRVPSDILPDLCRGLLLALLLAGCVFPGTRVLADSGDTPPDDAAGEMVGIFTDLGKLAIKVLYALMFIVFAVGMVKSGLGAQAAQAFGATGRVSTEMLNLAGGIVIFVIGLMTLPIANMIIDRVSAELFQDGFNIAIHNPLGY